MAMTRHGQELGAPLLYHTSETLERVGVEVGFPQESLMQAQQTRPGDIPWSPTGSSWNSEVPLGPYPQELSINLVTASTLVDTAITSCQSTWPRPASQLTSYSP